MRRVKPFLFIIVPKALHSFTLHTPSALYFVCRNDIFYMVYYARYESYTVLEKEMYI